MGLGLIWLVLKGLTAAIGFELYLDMGNVLLGLMVSVFTGILAGIIPAAQAANMNPVDAIRA